MINHKVIIKIGIEHKIHNNDRNNVKLKYGFYKKSLQHWSGKKTEEKVFNWSEVHLSEMTSYKIHTLGICLFVLKTPHWSWWYMLLSTKICLENDRTFFFKFSALIVCNRRYLLQYHGELGLLFLTSRSVLSSHQYRTLVCLFWSGNLHSPGNPTTTC